MKCSNCNSTSYIVNHHLSYEPEKTILLCKACHKKWHKKHPNIICPKDKNKSYFMMTLNEKTLRFLEGWYQLPIQDILRTLAAVDKATKETQL